MTTLIQAILVDDEIDSLLSIKEQLRLYCPEINVIGTYDRAEIALEKIKELRPDVVFLDIQMPKMNGLELAQQIAPLGINFVFITAHVEYAIRAVKLSALDYLLKPIEDIGELQKLTEKIKETKVDQKQLPVFNQLLSYEENQSFSQDTEIALADDKEVHFFKIEEIIRLEADGSYCEFYFTGGRKFKTSKGLGFYTPSLAPYSILQANRSEVINIEHREKIIKKGPYMLMSDGHKTLVTPKYRKNFPYFNDRKGPFFTR